MMCLTAEVNESDERLLSHAGRSSAACRDRGRSPNSSMPALPTSRRSARVARDVSCSPGAEVSFLKAPVGAGVGGR